jgi:hypothetical protein
MRFDRATIEGLDDHEFTPAEKKYLLARFFPKDGGAPWQEKLKNQWTDAQRWQRLIEANPAGLESRPYRYSHSFLLSQAAAFPPGRPGPAVTDFSNWIYSLYHRNKDPTRLAIGRRVERELLRRFLRSYIPLPCNRGWEPIGWKLIYEGIRESNRVAKTISTLIVEGKPIRGAPDFVFQEEQSERILIVDLKASEWNIPSDGWPNLRAKLWAYGQIDEYLKAPEVLLAGEIWWFDDQGIFPRGVRRWHRGDEELHRQNLELFKLYGGTSAVRN